MTSNNRSKLKDIVKYIKFNKPITNYNSYSEVSITILVHLLINILIIIIIVILFDIYNKKNNNFIISK